MTEPSLQPDLELMLRDVDAAVSPPAIALDPRRISEVARRRVGRRRVASAAIATCCLLMAGYVATRPGTEVNNIATGAEPNAAEIFAAFDRLSRQFEATLATAQEDLAQSDLSGDPSLVERLERQIRLAELEKEVARLEADVQQRPADDWQFAWLRSGARRLALANLDAERDPQAAAQSYRTLAANYAESPISEAALRALAGLSDR